MFVKLLRCLFTAAAFHICAVTAVAGTEAADVSMHREPVDVSAYPWSAIGKLFNEAGGSCTGVIVARDKILSAAHCVYSARTRRFLPASSLHFLAGYRSGQSVAHARVAWYETGSGYDPQRLSETLSADWVMLTLTEELPEEIVPLRLRRDAAPSGTRAIIAGYPEDRAHRMTADRNCELSGGDDKLVFHNCRGVRGYSGAPILVSTPGEGVQIAGIHVAMAQDNGIRTMIAVPARSIMPQEPEQDPDSARESDVMAAPVVAAQAAPDDAGSTLALMQDSGTQNSGTLVAWALSDRFDAVWPDANLFP